MFTVIRRKASHFTAGGWYILFLTAVFLFSGRSFALTRWSAVQYVPDADMLEGGSFVLNAHAYYFSDIVEGDKIRPVGTVNFGIIEWVNIEAGYTGGFSLGVKARILGETKPWMPSLAIGIHNMFTHREAYLNDRLSDSLGNELYFVFGKSIEPARLRLHFGMQMIPGNQDEMVNPFFVIEKYFGLNLYVTAEVHRREKKMHPSLFASWRFWKRRVEVSAGVVDITGMFMKDDVEPNSPFFKSSNAAFIRPGIWFGLRFKGGLRFGKTDGLRGVENSLADQSHSISELRSEVDSLKQLLRNSSSRLESMNRSLTGLTDSNLTDTERLKEIAIDRLAILNNLYNAEPFEPEAVSKVMAELVANRDRMLPALYEIIVDPVQETKLRSLAIAALGEIGTQAASDIIIEVLGKSPNPEMTIECLIALGKMKETRAVYLMQQLSNDPNDDVAFTAAEVLQKLEKETGISVTPIPAAMNAPESIPEKKIGSGETYREPPPPVAKPAAGGGLKPKLKPSAEPVPPDAREGDMVKADKAEFMEATVAEEQSASPSPVPEKGTTPIAPSVPSATAGEPGTVPAVTKPKRDTASVVAPEKQSGGDSAQIPSDKEPVAATKKVDEKSVPENVPEKSTVTETKKASPPGKKRTPKREQPKIDLSKESW